MRWSTQTALTTAFRYALIGAASGVILELLVPTIGPGLGLLVLIPMVLLYLASLPVWLMTHRPDLPIWVPPLNLALWGFAVGAVVGGLVPAMNLLVILGKVALRVLCAVVIALVAFPLMIVAFHPWEGPVDGYSRATQSERYCALAFSVAVLVATVWRLFRGSKIREEIKRAMDSLFSGSPHA